jgi:hypothetical protein
MNFFNKKEGIILTYNQDDTISTVGENLLVKPVWKYMLSGRN